MHQKTWKYKIKNNFHLFKWISKTVNNKIKSNAIQFWVTNKILKIKQNNKDIIIIMKGKKLINLNLSENLFLQNNYQAKIQVIRKVLLKLWKRQYCKDINKNLKLSRFATIQISLFNQIKINNFHIKIPQINIIEIHMELIHFKKKLWEQLQRLRLKEIDSQWENISKIVSNWVVLLLITKL